MPRVGEQAFGFDLLNDHVPFYMFIPRDKHIAERALAGDKRSIDLHAEPFAKLLRIGKGPLYAGHGSVDFDGLFDGIVGDRCCVHRQPPGCLMI